MADRLSPSARSSLMQRVKQKNTAPEKIVRSLLHRLGYRFRIHRKDLPGTPDIVLPSRRVAIFVHGCFWHGHDCRRGRAPSSNLEYWGPKLESNRERDSRKAAALAAAGWRVVVVWQCELDDEFALVRRLSSLLVTGAEIVPLEFLSDSR
ncbi:very short patch repair endonuclease [Thauera sp. ZXT1-4]|jgi:DNA mismatch endonuclease (patch repair protein)|uniref:very short patch repair endonuclease n=1 Tax=Thauera sp. ZXT1-4 TaxID=3460294 RepID=UPI0040406F4C